MLFKPRTNTKKKKAKNLFYNKKCVNKQTTLLTFGYSKRAGPTITRPDQTGKLFDRLTD